MSWLYSPPLDSVLRRADSWDRNMADRRTAALVRAGSLVRITRGSAAPAEQWRGLDPMARHAQLVWEVAARMDPGAVISHHSAAALLGIDKIGRWPDRVEVTVDDSGGSSGAIRRHRRPVSSQDVIAWGRHFVTTPARTAVDVAATDYLGGVVAADQALWARRPGGPLATSYDLARAADQYDGRASVRVRRALRFARPGADSVRESQSRVIIVAMGFPEPELQHPFSVSGRRVLTDFWWPEYRHAGEFDGTGKYFDPRLLHGRTAREALLAEKDRGDALRRQLRALSRWRTRELDHPALLYDILWADGLPSSKPRPAA